MNTDFSASVDRNAPLPDYPRPQLVRAGWRCLNGPWSYAVTDSPLPPKEYSKEIIVPFSPETELSGTHHILKKGEFLWYNRSIELPDEYIGKHILLHFDAVDCESVVWVNGKEVMRHIGGYLPFEADISSAIESRCFTVTVRVTDETERSGRARGKQSSHPGGIWYSQQSGIWQSVWMEAVPECYISSLRITPSYDKAEVSISAKLVGSEPAYAEFAGKRYPLPAAIPVPDFEAWSPENPKLYGFSVSCGDDNVQSYFAMRKFSMERDENGIPRLFLNGKPYFHNGLLDQGYYPDGLYTPSCDEAMVNDIRIAKEMGFNMLRKHIKVEPLRWYYHCDRLGMLVWQDMPSGGGWYDPLIISAPLFTGLHISDKHHFLFGRGNANLRKEFTDELMQMVDHLYNCPCIAMWVPFNEGWGQFDAASICNMLRRKDDTRTIDHASGWHDQGCGDVKSEHVYFRDYKFAPDKHDRAVVLSEFGGYHYGVEGHCFSKKSFGYKKFASPRQLEKALKELYGKIGEAKAEGLSAAVYTQLTDVENELNGLITYDRRAVKLSPDIMRRILKPLDNK